MPRKLRYGALSERVLDLRAESCLSFSWSGNGGVMAAWEVLECCGVENHVDGMQRKIFWAIRNEKIPTTCELTRI
ncbi:hypothetical protein Y032_0030g2214 [Ancylostoma ceylanicum]|uniref:Uncharacterized protein n=1 Tax=Ancylostoma ceylanicum TaxID=53326 RepID=A0A016US92_9BILA|nr:hypothetical protein Y032_0030g2214 [Ancylostoma ceylanicum]